MSMQISDILCQRRLSPLLQPILALDNAVVHGYEGLIRGPSNCILHSPIALLRSADQAGLRLEIELLCIDVLVAEFVRQRLEGQLFVNLSPGLLYRHPDLLDTLLATLDRNCLAPGRVVIELTEDSEPAVPDTLTEILNNYREIGLRLALDDLGEGYSSLRRWSELQPDYVKIDKHFISGINQDPIKLQFVRSLQQIAVNAGTRLIAEGIESRSELMLIRELGISLGQGYFIGRPAPVPAPSLEALDTMRLSSRSALTTGFNIQASTLLIEAPALSTLDTNETALDLFKANPQFHALAVVDSSRPVGLVNRYTLIDHFSRVYVRELHGRRSCTQFMDPSPLLVDKRTQVEELSKLVVDKGKATFTDGFVITDHGTYAGIGSGYDLMQLIMQLQITAARYSNPLTLLPGNVPINNHIEQLLQSNCAFWAAYCDLDNFKPFNDVYGYDCGDGIILSLSELLKEHLDPGLDFLGHIGGDDFFILFRSEDWESRCRTILETFAARCEALIDPEQASDGGYYSEDRSGDTVFNPFPTLSIGVVAVETGRFQTHHEVASAAAAAKKQAKKKNGNSLFMERRRTTKSPAK